MEIIRTKNQNNAGKIMLFDPSVRGHHPNYIKYLIKYWHEYKLSGYLDIVVSPRFLQEHDDVVNLALSYNQENINFIAITLEEEAILNSRKSPIKRVLRNFKEWQIICKYANLLKVNHCLLMYFDTCELPLAVGVKACCPFSGIFFRPSFHYHEFTQSLPSWKERIGQWRQKFFFSRILKNPQLKNLFCLDPFAVKYLEKFKTHVKLISLPDPVETFEISNTNTSNLRQILQIENQRKVFLLFGALTTRKGIDQLLDAIANLPTQLCQKMCLLMVGESNIKMQLKSRIAEIFQVKPIQIISHYKFVPDRNIPGYFQLADVVLAPYQRHVGMSGILLLAAAAQKPVLSSDYGLMGKLVQEYQLGLTVNSTIPKEITKGLTQFLVEDQETLCDRSQMKSFIQHNSPQEFARIIFENLSLNFSFLKEKKQETIDLLNK